LDSLVSLADSDLGRVLLFVFAVIAGTWALLEMSGALRRTCVSIWRRYWVRRAERLIDRFVDEYPFKGESDEQMIARIVGIIRQIEKNIGGREARRVRDIAGLPRTGAVTADRILESRQHISILLHGEPNDVRVCASAIVYALSNQL